jgi:hypothetical protein
LELAHIHGDDISYASRKREEWTSDDIWPAPLITGDDLIGMGFMPGPAFKEILTRVETEQLEGRLLTRGDARDFVKRHFAS